MKVKKCLKKYDRSKYESQVEKIVKKEKGNNGSFHDSINSSP